MLVWSEEGEGRGERGEGRGEKGRREKTSGNGDDYNVNENKKRGDTLGRQDTFNSGPTHCKTTKDGEGCSGERSKQCSTVTIVAKLRIW